MPIAQYSEKCCEMHNSRANIFAEFIINPTGMALLSGITCDREFCLQMELCDCLQFRIHLLPIKVHGGSPMWNNRCLMFSKENQTCSFNIVLNVIKTGERIYFQQSITIHSYHQFGVLRGTFMIFIHSKFEKCYVTESYWNNIFIWLCLSCQQIYSLPSALCNNSLWDF